MTAATGPSSSSSTRRSFRGDLITQCVFDGVDAGLPGAQRRARADAAAGAGLAGVCRRTVQLCTRATGTRDEVHECERVERASLSWTLRWPRASDGAGLCGRLYRQRQGGGDCGEPAESAVRYGPGRLRVQGINGTQLSPMLDRVTVRWGERRGDRGGGLLHRASRAVTVGTCRRAADLFSWQCPPSGTMTGASSCCNCCRASANSRSRRGSTSWWRRLCSKTPRWCPHRAGDVRDGVRVGCDARAGLHRPGISAPKETSSWTRARRCSGKSDEKTVLPPHGAAATWSPDKPVFAGVTVFHQESVEGAGAGDGDGRRWGGSMRGVQGPVDAGRRGGVERQRAVVFGGQSEAGGRDGAGGD